MFCRKRLPETLVPKFEVFEGLVPPLERAKAALTASVPGTRLPGRPLAETLLEFEEGLREVRDGMDGWRVSEVEDVWERANGALARSLSMAERLRLEALEPQGFEQLIGTIGDLIAPLQTFEDVAERFRALRV
jgi:hypothetical protein